MIKLLRNPFWGFSFLLMLLFSNHSHSQITTVLSDDFSVSAGSTYTTAAGAVGNSSNWSFLRSGNDFGARISLGNLSLTNNASGAVNLNGWAMASRSNVAAPYNTILNQNPGIVTWTFNMRQSRSNPSGIINGSYYGNAFILAGTSNTTATTGSGYAIIHGNSGKNDPIRLVRYTAGLRTSTVLMSSNTTNLADFGNQYLSVKITYIPSSNTWQMYVRNDGSIFQDPSLGSLVSQGTVVNSAGTGTASPLIGLFWNAGTKNNQTAAFDNIKMTVATPAITSLSPSSKVAGTAAFTLTVNGINFINGSTVKWNGANRVTTYISATQLTASIPATDIVTAGSAAITVTTGSATSNTATFTIDPANVPSISTSTTALNPFTTIAGTASASQSFTSSGSNLTENITVTAPANFEVSLNNTNFFSSVIVPAAATTVHVRVKAAATPGNYSGVTLLVSSGAATKQVAMSALVLALEPTTSATAVSFSGTNSISTNITWTNGNGSNHLVVIKAGSAISDTPTDATTYSASTNFGAGSVLGSASYVVYSGTGNSVTVSELSPSTTYYVSVFGYNGTAGVENYRITTPGTNNVTTPAAPTGLQITAQNTAFKIDFDTTVAGINNSAYDGAGFASAPEPGELDSDGFVISSFTTGAAPFGTEPTEDSPEYGNGVSEGDVTDGGFYAFEVAPGNRTLGFQPSIEGYGTGSTTLRLQNQTGVTITSLNVGYTVYIYNDEAGINTYDFLYSANNSTYTSVTAFAQSSTVGADAAPGWKAHCRVTTISVSIAPGAFYYLRWNSQNGAGTAYDEIGLDDITVVANPTSTYVSFKDAIETFIVAGNAQLSGDATVNNTLAFAGGKVIIGANTLTINGTINNAAPQGLRGSASSNLIIGGTLSQTLSFDQTTSNTTNLFNNVSIATSAGNTTTAGNSFLVNGTLFTEAGQTLNLGTNALTGTLATITNNGTITTQNTTTTPVATGKTWGGTGTFTLNAATTAQTLVAGTYNNVTVSTTGGATTNAAVTVNGVLHLPNANPNATTGALATGTNVLIMGPLATNTGTGDVSGIVTRNSIVANTLYTMGHLHTDIIFPPVGTLPSTISLKTTLGVAPAQKADGILRTYDFIQTGGTGTKAIIKAHYLDTEINGNTENRLVDWVVVVSPAALFEQSRSNYSTTENWVELANVNMAFFNTTFGNKLLTLANAQVATSVWDGSESNSWVTAANWTPTGTPNFGTNVIIPDATTTPNDPVISPGAEVLTLTIEAGGIVNNPAEGATLNVMGSNGAWINNGTFNPGIGTVVFNTTAVNSVVNDATIAGSTTFNNITVASGSTLRVLTDNVMNIAGTFTKTGSFIAGSVHNTVEYSGTNQTIVVPNGITTAYHNLTISGTGAIVPATLNVNGNLTTNTAVNFAGTTVNLAGTDTDGQIIGGSVSPILNNLVINKTAGQVNLSNSTTVGGTLTLTSGLLNIGSNNLTLGSAAVAGLFSETNMIVADGTGVVRRPYTGTGSYTFPIGELTSDARYSPITVNVTSGTFNNAFVGVNVTDAVHPNNYSTAGLLSRYWNVTQTGITGAVADINATYVADDIEGGGALAAAQLNGTFNVVSNPWMKYTDLSGTTLSAQNAPLTAGQTSAFTGITSESLVAFITGEGTFCANEVVTLTAEVSAGDPPFTYSWSNGLGSAATATPPTAAPGTVTYTLTVRDANGIASVDTADVTVTPAAVAGTLTGTQNICEGFAEAITLTGYTGNIVRWERSASLAFPNPTFLSSTNATLTGEEMGNLNATRYFRAVVQNGSCAEVYSNAITVTVESTTWSGTWSNGVPTASTAAIFTSNFTATADIVACSIQVTNNAVVSIPSGFDVTLGGRITVTSGSFTLEDNAHLVQLSDVENIGNITVKKNSSVLYKLDYTVWSSPVANQNLFDFSPLTLANRFYTLGISDGEENYISTDPFGNSFNAATGYLIRMPHHLNEGNINYAAYETGTYAYAHEGIFTGVPHNGDITIPLNTADQRYSMVGNPYPSPINVHAFFDANEDVLDPTAALYFWRKRNNEDATSYATITKDAYTYNQATGGGQEWDEFFNLSDEEEWVINTAQGFFVRAKEGVANPELLFNNVMRRANAHDGQFFRNGQLNDVKSRYWLNLTSETRFSQAAIVYSNTATLGVDYGRDGNAFSQGTLAIYSLAETNKLAIQARPSFAVSDVVPLGFKTSAQGTYTLTLHRYDGLFADGQEIYLKDNLLGIFHNLKQGSYQFTAPEGTDETRFEIVYTTSALGTNAPSLSSNEVIVYKKDKTLTINSGTAVMDEVTVFDTRGRLIYTATDINSSEFVIDQLTAEQQMLILNINTDKGAVSKKVIY